MRTSEPLDHHLQAQRCDDAVDVLLLVGDDCEVDLRGRLGLWQCPALSWGAFSRTLQESLGHQAPTAPRIRGTSHPGDEIRGQAHRDARIPWTASPVRCFLRRGEILQFRFDEDSKPSFVLGKTMGNVCFNARSGGVSRHESPASSSAAASTGHAPQRSAMPAASGELAGLRARGSSQSKYGRKANAKDQDLPPRLRAKIEALEVRLRHASGPLKAYGQAAIVASAANKVRRSTCAYSTLPISMPWSR